jgi:uncharacterized protein
LLQLTARGALLVSLGLFASLALGVQQARAAEEPIPPMPTQWVTDAAGALMPTTRDAVNGQLAEYYRTTGHQFIVYIGQTTGDTPLEDWTIHAFTNWKVGRKGLDDGLALFIFMRDHKIRIEVGYGLEGQLTDARASQIARTVIATHLKEGDVDGAVTAGVNALIAAVGGAPPEQTGETQTTGVSPVFWVIAPFVVFFIVTIFMIAAFIRSTAYAARRGYTIGSGGYGPGWWGGVGGFSGGSSGGSDFGGGDSGGFSGGGGMGGGGGASASW